jgi:hypothetical protein
MNGTADDVLWEEDNGENCSVAMKGFKVVN